jgi:hypothetical protein
LQNLGLECAAELPPQHFYGQKYASVKKSVILRGTVMGAMEVMLIASIPVSEIIGIACGMFVLTIGAMALGFGILKAGGEHIRL